MTENTTYSLVSVIVPTYNRCEDVIACVASILESDYPNFEVVVVDNGSADETVAALTARFGGDPQVKLVASDRNLGAGGGRNEGVRHAAGNLLLFVYDDNVVAREMIRLLVEVFENREDCCQIGPLMAFLEKPDRIWCRTCRINFLTSQAMYDGTGEPVPEGEMEILTSGHLPNCFMVRDEDFHAVGGFDEKYIVMYEEADLSYAIQRHTGKSCLVVPQARIFHNVKSPEPDSEHEGPLFTFVSQERAFLTARNRVYFMRKQAGFWQFLVFILLFLPLSMLFYEYHILRSRQFGMAWQYFRGVFKGFTL